MLTESDFSTNCVHFLYFGQLECLDEEGRQIAGLKVMLVFPLFLSQMRQNCRTVRPRTRLQTHAVAQPSGAMANQEAG